MKNITKYFGFVTVGIEWLGFLLCMIIGPIDWSEPGSQFGYYSETRLIFGVILTAAATACYLFGRWLDAYWRHTSLILLLAGICFAIVGWIPYEPYARNLVFDVHNAAVVLAIILYALPMLFIGYKKAHQPIARISYVLFFVTTGLAGLSILARVTDTGIIYAQILVLVPAQIWLVITNLLLLQHHKEIARGHIGKL